MFTFYSKIDNWLIIIFVMGSISLLVSPFIYHRHKHIPLVQSYFVLFFPTVFALVLMWLPVFKTSYQLTQTDLIIHSGFSNTVIPRNTIIDVKPSHRLIASPALSLDRLDMSYQVKPNKIEHILVSPENKNDFIQHLNLR